MKFRALPAVPYHRDVTATAEAAIAARFETAFAAIGAKFAKALRMGKIQSYGYPYNSLAKAADDPIDDLDLSEISDLSDGMAADLAPVVEDVSKMSATIGLGDGKAFVNVVNDRAVSAVNDGLAPAIKGMTDATRTMLRQTIATALAAGKTQAQIADEIGSAYALSSDRAKIIASTEVSRANSVASLTSYRVAAASGVDVYKGWLAEPGCCPTCSGNQAAGPIALDQDFPSGHPCPAAHPGCRCAISPFIGEANKMAVSAETLMAPYHRRAQAIQELRGGVAKYLEEMRGLEKIFGVDVSEAASRCEEIIKEFDAYLASPLPLPWDILLGQAEAAGSA